MCAMANKKQKQPVGTTVLARSRGGMYRAGKVVAAEGAYRTVEHEPIMPPGPSEQRVYHANQLSRNDELTNGTRRV